jgi:hypothetical protein
MTKEALAMEDERTHVAVAAGKNTEVAEKLERILAGPNDRAFVVCSLTDCVHNLKGSCTIYAVLDVPSMKRDKPCEKYQPKL